MKKYVLFFFLLVIVYNIYAQNDTLFLWKDSVCIHTTEREHFLLPSNRDTANTIICEINQDSAYSNCVIGMVYLGTDLKSKKKVNFDLVIPDDTAKNHSERIREYSDLQSPFDISKKWIIKVRNKEDSFCYESLYKESQVSPIQDTIQMGGEEEEQGSKKLLWIIIAGVIAIALCIVIIFSPIRKKIWCYFKKIFGVSKNAKPLRQDMAEGQQGQQEENKPSDSSNPNETDNTDRTNDSNGSNSSTELVDQNEDYNQLHNKYNDLEHKYEELKEEFKVLQNENDKLKICQNGNDQSAVYEEIARKIRSISIFSDIPEKFTVDHLCKDDIRPLFTKLFFKQLDNLFSSDKYPYLSRMWKVHAKDDRIDDEKKLLYDLNNAINNSRRTQSDSQQKLDTSYCSLSAEQKKQIFNLVWTEFKRQCRESKVDNEGLNNIANLDSGIAFLKNLYIKDVANANSETNKKIIDRVLSSALPADAVNKIAKEINDKVKTEELHLSPTNQDELVAQIAEKLNAPLSEEKIGDIIEKKAEEMSVQKVAEAQKSANEDKKALEEKLNLSESKVAALSEKLDENQNKIKSLEKEKENASDNYKRQKEKTELKHQEEIDGLKTAHAQELQDAEKKRIADLEGQKKADLEEKEKAVNAIVLEKASIEQSLEYEKNSHKADLSKLKDSVSSYVILIKSTFDYAQNAIRTSYSKGNDGSNLSDFVNKNIINNRIYSFEDFKSELNNILANTENIELDGFKTKMRKCFVGCLDMKMPTWLDVLARLYLYSNVDFISAQFASKGINMTRVGEAFMATNTILSQIGVELIMPTLFSDHYNEDKYDLKDIRNIDSYVDDIANHVKSPNEIIDLYTLGYKIGGELKEKPIVSKF